jgi:hypothetical protein
VQIDTIIVDNFLDNPDKVRESILTVSFNTSGKFPGLRSDSADDDYQVMVKEKIHTIFGRRFKFRTDRDCFKFQLCLHSDTTWIHKDDTDWAGVLYLTPNAPVNSGTGIFDKEDNLVTMIGNLYNRIVFYRGDLYHRSIIPGFGSSLYDGRLTQVFFFDEQD